MPQQVNKEGYTALIWACYNGLESVALERKPAIQCHNKLIIIKYSFNFTCCCKLESVALEINNNW